MNENELLQKAIESGIIDFNTIQKQVEMNERKKYLEMHEFNIWQGSDGKWHTYVSDTTKPEGRRRVKRSTEEQLNDFLVEYYKCYEHDITINELFYMWSSKKIEYGEMQRQTLDRYERDFKRYFVECGFDKRKVKYLTEGNLEDFIRTEIKSKELSAKAWGNLRTLINGMFKFARKRGYSKINISNFMSELDLSKRLFSIKWKDDFECIFTKDEIDAIVSYINDKPSLNGFGVLLGIYTGMRVGEIVALKHEDIFPDYIYVRRTQIRYMENGKDVYHIRDNPKTDAGIRKVVVTEKVKPILNRLKMDNLDNEYLFYDKSKKKIKSIHALTCYLYRVCEKLGIKQRSMHCLRKTYATRLINAGIDESIIISQLGHTEIDTTKQYYYYNDKTVCQIAERLEKVVNY